MKALILALLPLIAAGFVGCMPPYDYPKVLPQPKDLLEQLDYIFEFSSLFFANQERYVDRIKSHFFFREVEELYSTFCEDLDVLVKDALEFRAFLIKHRAITGQEIPQEQRCDRLLQTAVIVSFVHSMNSNLSSLLEDIEMHLLDECKITEKKAAVILESYGFPTELLNDVYVKDLKNRVKAFIAEGSPLDKITKAHGVGLTLRSPDGLGDRLLWLHEFGLAVATNGTFETALLENLAGVSYGKELVELLKKLAANDGALHKIVVDECCGDIFGSVRAVRFTYFRENEAARYVKSLKDAFRTLRPDMLGFACECRARCPFEKGREYSVDKIKAGNFRKDEVKCEPGKLMAEDGSFRRIEQLLQEDAV